MMDRGCPRRRDAYRCRRQADAIAQRASSASAPAANDAEQLVLGKTLPNGLAFDHDGNIVIANFGTDAIALMTRDGA